MIKEKKKNTKYNLSKNKTRTIVEYARTILCSIMFAVLITAFLTIHARNEMIEDILSSAQEQKLMDKKVAMKIITQTDLLSNLRNKTYQVCMNAGEICEIAVDYKDAQIAYEYAILKTKPNNYTPYYKLIKVLVAQEKFNKANDLLDNIKDVTNKKLLKFKTKSYITIGDKYYSIGKFLSAAKSYENASFYYNKFQKRDLKIENAILERIINSYIQAADIMVKNGLNTDAVRFLKRAEAYQPDNFEIKYKLAIIFSDLDPEKSVSYFNDLLEECPQNIDYGVYNRALMKSANIADLEGRTTEAKYYRYKIHSVDLFVNRKVLYKNDVETAIKSFKLKKIFFNYPLNFEYQVWNVSNNDIIKLYGDFVLCLNEKPLETISVVVANKDKPMHSYSMVSNDVNVEFKRKIYTQKELENYTIKVYLYKDEKYKTLVKINKIPLKNI